MVYEMTFIDENGKVRMVNIVASSVELAKSRLWKIYGSTIRIIYNNIKNEFTTS